LQESARLGTKGGGGEYVVQFQQQSTSQKVKNCLLKLFFPLSSAKISVGIVKASNPDKVLAIRDKHRLGDGVDAPTVFN
jgi:hypothetical protein